MPENGGIYSGFNVSGPVRTTPGYLEILKFPAGLDAIKSVVLDASTVSADSDGRRILRAGTLVAKNGSNQYQRYLGAGSGSATNEIQTLTVDATGGTYTLTFSGQTTTAIAEAAVANGTPASVQAALEGLSNINVGDVTVTGAAGGPYTITFLQGLGGRDVPAITTTATNLTGGASTAVITTPTPGTAGSFTIAGVLAYDVEFADASSNSDAPAAIFFHECVFRSDRIVDFGTYGAAAATALSTCKFE